MNNEKVIDNYTKLLPWSILIAFIVLSLQSYRRFENLTLYSLLPLVLALTIASIIISMIAIFYIKRIQMKKRLGLKINEEGIFIPEWKNELCEWNTLQIKFKPIKYLIFINAIEITLINNKTSSNTYYQFGYFQIDSLIELTKKYCPKDHDFYNAVKEYANNRNIPF